MEGTVKKDAGVAIRDGVKSLVKQGVCAEKIWPYKIASFARKPSATCYRQARNHQVTSYNHIVGLQQMRQCQAEGYPSCSAFRSLPFSNPMR